MRNRYPIALVGLLLGVTAWGQQDPSQAPATPAPAFGQELPPPQVTLAPPVTSLDQASLEPAVAARSYLQPGVHLTESVNSNLGSNGTVGITRILGSLDMTRFWNRYAFSADYVGGASLYSDNWGQPTQVHEMTAAQRYSWRNGQIQVRDCLTYLPEGSFGFSGFNGVGGGALGGSCGISGSGGTFGSLGNGSRLTNAATLDLRESLSPRSSITAAGGYTFTDFTNNTTNNTSQATRNSRQENAQVGYSRVLNHFDQLGLQYGFDHFEFPLAAAGSINSQTIQVQFEHAVSGRMDLTLGAGPQFITLHPVQTPTTSQVSVAARAILRYKFSRDTISLSYNRHTTAGSGIQLGSQTDEVRASLGRALTRLWTASLDTGYSHHNALLPVPTNSNATGGSYQMGFGGGGLNRRLGRFFSLQMHYQYTYQLFSSNIASSNRHIGDITLSWHPAPIRLD